MRVQKEQWPQTVIAAGTDQLLKPLRIGQPPRVVPGNVAPAEFKPGLAKSMGGQMPAQGVGFVRLDVQVDSHGLAQAARWERCRDKPARAEASATSPRTPLRSVAGDRCIGSPRPRHSRVCPGPDLRRPRHERPGGRRGNYRPDYVSPCQHLLTFRARDAARICVSHGSLLLMAMVASDLISSWRHVFRSDRGESWSARKGLSPPRPDWP